MMRGSFACMLRFTRPVVVLGLTSFGWLKRLKQSPVKRIRILSVMSKYLKNERSWFHDRGPRKKFRAFQLRLSETEVVTTFPFAKVNGSRLLLKTGAPFTR